MKKTKLREICAVLGKQYTMEIVVFLRKGNNSMTGISRGTDIPYTMVQGRIAEMERAGLVVTKKSKTRDLGKHIKEVRVCEFKHVLTPSIIKLYLEDS